MIEISLVLWGLAAATVGWYWAGVAEGRTSWVPLAGISVLLAGIEDGRAVVHVAADPVAVRVVVGVAGARIARVPDTVAVGIVLTWVGHCRTVVDVSA